MSIWSRKRSVYIIVKNGMFRNIVRVCNEKVVAYALANLFNNNCNSDCYFTVEEHEIQERGNYERNKNSLFKFYIFCDSFDTSYYLYTF